MKPLLRRLGLVVGILVLGGAAAPAQNLITNGTFESDTVTAVTGGIPANPGTTPAGWTVQNANTLQEAVVVAGGSPFSGGGSKSLMIYDADTGNRMQLFAAFSGVSGDPAVTLSFDFCVNQTFNGNQMDAFDLRVQANVSGGVGTSYSGFRITDNTGGTGGGLFLQAYTPTGVMNLGAGISTGTWYNVTLTLPAGGASGTAYQVTVTPYGGSTSSYASSTGYTGTLSGGYGIAVNSGLSGNAEIGISLDNFSLSLVPAPEGRTAAFLGVGLGLWALALSRKLLPGRSGAR